MGVYRKCALGFLAFALTIAEPAIAATKSAQDYYNDGFEAQSEENWYRAVEAYQEALQKNTVQRIAVKRSLSRSYRKST